jgi:hypothetical protein
MLKAIKEACEITLENTAGKPTLFADYMSDTTVEFSMESTYATLKGVNVIRWDGQRTGTLSTSMSVYSPKWIALLFGTEFASSSVDIAKRVVIDVAAGGTTTTVLEASPISGSIFMYNLDTDGRTHGTEITADVATTPATGKYYYNTSTKIFTLNATDFATAKKVVVYYLTASTLNNFKVTTTGFPSGYKMHMTAKMRGTDQGDTYHQIYFPNIKPQSNVTLTMSDDNVGTIDITWDIMADTNGTMMQMTEIV